MSISLTKSGDDQDENVRIARRILAALRVAGVDTELVADMDAPPVIPDDQDGPVQ